MNDGPQREMTREELLVKLVEAQMECPPLPTSNGAAHCREVGRLRDEVEAYNDQAALVDFITVLWDGLETDLTRSFYFVSPNTKARVDGLIAALKPTGGDTVSYEIYEELGGGTLKSESGEASKSFLSTDGDILAYWDEAGEIAMDEMAVGIETKDIPAFCAWVKAGAVREALTRHKHTDECLAYAARTGKPFCIAPCAESREAGVA